MSHLMKYSEWQGASGKWYATDISNFAEGSGNWWNVPRMLNMELTDFILLLKNTYNANLSYHNEVLLWNWNNYNDCHKFVLYVNKEARQRKFFI